MRVRQREREREREYLNDSANVPLCPIAQVGEEVLAVVREEGKGRRRLERDQLRERGVTCNQYYIIITSLLAYYLHISQLYLNTHTTRTQNKRTLQYNTQRHNNDNVLKIHTQTG